MHFALITAPTITEFRSADEIRSSAVQQAALQPQLGILTVAAVLERWGDTPHLFDANAEYLRFAGDCGTAHIDGFAHHMAEAAVRSNADVYGFSSICSTFPLSLRIASAVKSLRPHATVLFGGPQASVVDVPVVSQFPCVDFILRGEVEASLPAFLGELRGDYDFARVPGLTFRDGTVTRRTPNAPAIEDLDSLPSPAYQLSGYLRGARAASIELGRGCPFSCTFCSTNDFFRRRFRLRSPERVLEDMRSIAKQYGIRHFELVHDMFTVDRKRVVAFCETMKASGEVFTWDCSARTDCVDEDLLQQMAASGCKGLFFGIESGSVRMQRIIDKDLDPARAEEMLGICERLGIRTTASLIVGFPEETWSDVADTLRVYIRSARCSRSHPQINLLAPLANTPLHTAHAHELVLEDFCSDMSHQGLSQAPDDLELIQSHPAIFPNFYMIPTPLLERDVLFELREFLGMAVDRYRWLLCAIAQAMPILQFHSEWVEWRTQQRGALSKAALRRYYAEVISRLDLLRFLRGSRLRNDAAVSTLLQVEEALLAAAEQSTGKQTVGLTPLTGRHGESEASVALARGVTLLELPYNLAELTNAIANGTFLAPGGTVYYATRREENGEIHIRHISPFLANLLRACGDNDWEFVVAAAQDVLGIADPQLLEDSVRQLILRLEEDRWLQRTRVPWESAALTANER